MSTTAGQNYYCDGCKSRHEGAPYLTYTYYGTVKNYCIKNFTHKYEDFSLKM